MCLPSVECDQAADSSEAIRLTSAVCLALSNPNRPAACQKANMLPGAACVIMPLA